MLAPFRAVADATKAFYENPLNPVSRTSVGRTAAAMAELFERSTRIYAKPEFGLDETFVDGRRVPVADKPVWQRPFARLLHFERDLPRARKADPRILVVAPMSGHYATLLRGTVARILVDVNTRRVAGYDANGRLLVDYPATIGSSATPSPSGDHHVKTVALNPNYTYDPKKNFQQGDNDKVLVVPPGPNGPVGTVWIGLSKPTYGIHGTPTPSTLFRNQSMGCVRLTNWDAEELARMVSADKTTVEFLPQGMTIADATGGNVAPAPASAEPAVAAETTTAPAETAPAAPLDYADPLAAKRAPAEPVYENTSEEEADALAPTGDPLTDALTGALPSGFVLPPVDEQP